MQPSDEAPAIPPILRLAAGLSKHVAVDGIDFLAGDVLLGLENIRLGAPDLVFMDSPYNLGFDYGKGSDADRRRDHEFTAWLASVVRKASLALRPGGAFWMLINERYADEVGAMLTEHVGPRRNRIIWRETFGTYREQCFPSGHRHLFYHVKPAVFETQMTWNPDAIRVPSRRMLNGDHRAGGKRPPEKQGRVPDDFWICDWRDDFCYIQTSDGRLLIVSPEDFEYLTDQCNWSINQRGYARGSKDDLDVLLHIAVASRMGLDCSKEIDHKNRDPLDNRRSNLREATRSENCANRGINSNNTSGFKGVDFHKSSGKWRARICVNRKSIDLGLFDKPHDAHEAYVHAANRYFGEFANDGLDSDSWEISRLCGTFKERVDWHPCQLPSMPLERILLSTSNAGDLVLEPFSGSGSLAVVAQRLGRRYIGIDENDAYVTKAVERVRVAAVTPLEPAEPAPTPRVRRRRKTKTMEAA